MRKPNLAISFWALYTLAFTVGLPMIIYYSSGSAPDFPGEPTNFTYISIGLAIIGWALLLAFYGRFYVKTVFTGKSEILKGAEEGSTIIATVINKVQEDMIKQMAVLQLRLAFTNLAGTPVEVGYELMDSKPAERRYEKGSQIELIVNMKKKGGLVVPKGVQVVRNEPMVFLYTFIFLVLIGVAVYYPVFVDWRYFILPHPWTLIPLINLGTAIFIGFLIGLIGKASGVSTHSLRMVMYGVRVQGEIVSYRQTGMYINEQPQVAFNIEYTDKQGMQHSIVIKKIVSLLETHKLATGPVEIMYLPEDPGKVVFFADLSL
ncbi:hypothetical protein [Chitinophaga sp.]|uniref:hypothetical protein n=1 Tax=Chitinophaga sp. TaxID=1869181 RepID=UPI0031D5BDB3